MMCSLVTERYFISNIKTYLHTSLSVLLAVGYFNPKHSVLNPGPRRGETCYSEAVNRCLPAAGSFHREPKIYCNIDHKLTFATLQRDWAWWHEAIWIFHINLMSWFMFMIMDFWLNTDRHTHTHTHTYFNSLSAQNEAVARYCILRWKPLKLVLLVLCMSGT